ncbi:unnamed protein product [Fusarium graminearum]|uniref:Uncharacterized protein n=1 Tax=Gibberella zeae TaxID=5518 RepID=A0A9N8RRE2_GIBZA|nr:unnamed protein product [Fusarium graminearum]
MLYLISLKLYLICRSFFIPKDRYPAGSLARMAKRTSHMPALGPFLTRWCAHPRTACNLVDLEAPFLANITEEQFNAFKCTLFSVQDAPFCWVTRACQIGYKNPDYALVNGIARSIR